MRHFASIEGVDSPSDAPHREKDDIPSNAPLTTRPPPGAAVEKPWFFQSARFKRFSVLLSIGLSVTSLITATVAQLMHLDQGRMHALAVTGIVVNAVSVALSALTSLDWRTEMAREGEFLARFLVLVQEHPDGKLALSANLRDVRQRRAEAART